MISGSVVPSDSELWLVVFVFVSRGIRKHFYVVCWLLLHARFNQRY
jgi:hypothetical protein